jgi:hypothetical protein
MEEIGGISYTVTGSTEDGIKAFEQLGQAAERAGQKVAAFGHQGGQILDTKGIEEARSEVLALEKAINELQAKFAGANFDSPNISGRQWKEFGDAADRASQTAASALARVRDAQDDLNRAQERAQARQGTRTPTEDPRIAQYKALEQAELSLLRSGTQTQQQTEQNITRLAQMYGVAGQAATAAGVATAAAARTAQTAAANAATAATAIGAAWQRAGTQINAATQAQARAANAAGGGGGGGRGGGGRGGGGSSQSGGFNADVVARATDRDTNFVQLANSIRAIQANDRVNITVRLNGGETPAQLQKVVRALDDLHAKERINLTIRANAELAEDTIAKVHRAILDAEKRGAVIKLRVDTSDVEAATVKAKAFAGAFRGFVAGSNIGGGLLIGAQSGGSLAGVAGTGAAIGVLALTKAVIEGTSAGIKYNSQLEQSTVAFKQFTGSAALAEQSVARLRQFADKTPFSTQQSINVGRAFISLEHGDVEAMLHDVDLAGQLATVSKKGFEEGFEDATVAIRELMGGQTQSFATRFDISRETLNRLKEAGLAGHALVEAAVKATGASKELLEALGHTGQGELSTFTSRMDEMAQILTKPLFDELVKGLRDANTYLAQNKGTWNEWGDNVGAVLGRVGAGLVQAGTGLGIFIDTSVKMQQYFNSLAHGRSPTEDRRLATQRAEAASGGVTLTGGTPGSRRGSEDDARRQATIRAANQEVERVLALRGQEEVKLEHIQRDLTRNAAAQAKITSEYEKQLTVLQAILDMQSAPDFRRQREVAGFDRQSAQIDEVRRRSQAPVGLRAEVAAYDVQLKREQEILDLKSKRRDIIKAIGDQEIAIANEIKEKQLAVAEDALKHWQQQIEAAQYLRQVAIDSLRERQIKEKESRDDALRGAQQRASAEQQANQDYIDGVRQTQEAEKTQRDEALRGLQEQIRVRRQLVQDALDGIREVMAEEQRQFEDASRLADRANARRQESYRSQIDNLQKRDQAEQKRAQGKTAAERELEALEKVNTERQRSLALEDATRAVTEARSSREWRDARRNLARLQEQQAFERHKEELQAQAEREKAQREEAQTKRQEQIAALQEKAQEEDRKYQQQKEARDDAFRAKREAEEASLREAEKVEKARERQEDEQVRARQRADAALEARDRAELIRLQKAAQEQQRQDQQAIMAMEESNRRADKAAQEALRQAEKVDKEKTHQEQVAVQAEQRRIEEARFRMQQDAAARQLVQDQQHLKDLQASSGIEIQLIDNRLKILNAENLNLILWAAAAQVKFDDAKERADNWDRIKVAAQQMAIIDTTERIYNLTEQEKGRLFVLEQQKRQLDLQATIANAAKSDAQDALDLANEAVAKLATVEKNLAIVIEGADKAAEAAKTAGQQFLEGLAEGVTNGNPLLGWALQRGVDMANAIVDGFKNRIAQSTPDTAAATEAWAQAALVDPAADILDSHSPSGVYSAFADSVIDGFTQQILRRNQEIIDAVVEPYDYLINTTMPDFVRDFSQTGIDAHTGWVDEWNNNGGAATADQAVTDTFVLALQSGVQFTLAMGEAGAAAAIAWENAWALQNLPQFVSNQMASMITLINNYNNQFSVVGRNNAISWQNAFQSAMNSFHPNCPTCDGQAVGGSGGGGGSHAGIMPQPSPGAPGSGSTRTGGGGGGPWYFSGRYDARGWPIYSNSNTGEARAFPPGTNPNGGTASVAQAAGSALPRDMYAGAVASGTGATSVTSSRTVSLNVTNHISGADMDMEHLSTVVAQKTLDGVIAALDVTHQAAGTPTDRVLPGAL